MPNNELIKLAVLAAKNAGLDIEYYDDIGEAYDAENNIWNPLDDNGAAFDLEVALYMLVSVGNGRTGAVPVNDQYNVVIIEHGSDKASATRLAITSVAANIGRKLL